MAEFWGTLGPILFLLALGFGVGRVTERMHIAALTRREQEFADVTVNNLRHITDPKSVTFCTMVMGDAVIATDYFKSFAAKLRNIIGGEVRTFDTLLKRARREALLRLLEQARSQGATEVWNVRFGTSNISSSSRNNPAVSVEVFAFGTAVRRT